MTKRTKLLQFTPSVQKRILERDKGCLFCRLGLHMDELLPGDKTVHDIMHVVNKSQGGLGVEQNGIEGCRGHHTMMDNGKHSEELRNIARGYVICLYPGWSEESVTYNKWDGFKFSK